MRTKFDILNDVVAEISNLNIMAHLASSAIDELDSPEPVALRKREIAIFAVYDVERRAEALCESFSKAFEEIQALEEKKP